MSLILEVTLFNDSPPSRLLQHEFNKEGGTIGRQPATTWTLDDEHRHLSGSHATVEWVNGDYYLVDTSTNGVFVNSSSKAIGSGNRVRLDHEMNLEMGGYKLVVRLPSEQHTDNSSSSMGIDIDDLIPDDETSTHQLTNQTLKQEPRDYRQGDIAVNSSYIPTDVDIRSSPLDSEASEDLPETIMSSGSEALTIPAGWRDDDSSSTAETQQPTRESTKQSIQKTPIKHPSDETPDENSIDKNEDSTVVNSQPSKDRTQTDEATQHIPKVQIKQESLKSQNQESEQAVLAAFLKGAGLDENLLQQSDATETLEKLGGLFRLTLEGTMDVLLSRSKIKNEMIPMVDMTVIQKAHNNPIKFAVNVEEAMQRLLVPNNTKSYMIPEQAIQEAYDDIKGHQVAVVAGFQRSLVYVLKRFKPERLIERLEEESPISANIPLQREASLWNKFEDLYEAIEGEAEDDFNRLFGQEFAKAYDDQIELLLQQRINEGNNE